MDLGLLEHSRKYILNLLENGKRIDGRPLLAYRRSLNISINVSKNAEGSAMVSLGNTKVIAGVKMEIGEPFPDTPDEGVMIVSAEFLPGAYPTYEPGPPGPEEIELSRVVDRGLREARTIDLKKLVLKEGEKVWLVFVDIYIINDDGNLYDASNLAALAALYSARFPKYDPETFEIDYHEHTNERLPLRNFPISITFGKIGNKIILDPIKIEESAMDGGITITVTEDKKIRAIQKYGRATFTLDEIDELVGIAIERSERLRQRFKQSLSRLGIL